VVEEVGVGALVFALLFAMLFDPPPQALTMSKPARPIPPIPSSLALRYLRKSGIT
jgi:hypothetical protein